MKPILLAFLLFACFTSLNACEFTKRIKEKFGALANNTNTRFEGLMSRFGNFTNFKMGNFTQSFEQVRVRMREMGKAPRTKVLIVIFSIAFLILYVLRRRAKEIKKANKKAEREERLLQQQNSHQVHAVITGLQGVPMPAQEIQFFGVPMMATATSISH
jgi:hypothetical protein